MKKKWSFLTALMLTFVLILTACGGGNEESESSGSEGSDGLELTKDGKFSYVVSGEFPPFSTVDENGDLDGFDVAVGKAIAEKLGLEPAVEKFKFSGMVSAIQSGRYDAAVASHTITDERKEAVNFSEPYYYSGPVLYVQPGSDIKSVEDLSDKDVAVSKGSTYEKSAQEYTDKISNYDSDQTALRALSEGKHDAVITDDITGKQAIEEGFKIEKVEQLGTSEQAVAIKKENANLLEAVNKALQELKEDGTLKELSEEYIGVDITQNPDSE
ncbi:transporter substrate-binding domain-containing protein [Pseudalkalibacillus hwajinpoensis]|uniref:Transporter substrate-binding domain-containing protein n=1 Tax=Guptibacillus hwajinpoensis TaxID=208199 RepID=A0A4U1MIH8_9BACL|nr:transporter substrate-binding domain-containing protein [Pseudalkalibacillus hwajinpoensis]TKD70324.1 transporter substrate-binding domain-containing protein [Pseudalkalibacillus hwajinpoensis]